MNESGTATPLPRSSRSGKADSHAVTPRFRGRVRALGLLALAGVAVVFFRAQQLQLWRHDELSQKAQQEYLREIRVPAARGNIFDRHGDSGQPLASSVQVPSVYANPSQVDDPRPTARLLSDTLQVDLDTVYRRLASDRVFVWIKRRVSPQLEAKVRAAKLAGVHITYEARRYYPNKSLAAHVLGFVGIDGHGLEGVERSADDSLRGEAQVIPAMRDGRGRSVLSGNIDPAHLSRGANMNLTIDRQIQHNAERVLAAAVKDRHAKAGHVVVLDVATAEVLAMAVVPTFNPNEAGRAAAHHRRNRAMTDVYEPASTFKPLTIAGALQSGAIKEDALVFCENGRLKIGRHTIHDGHPAAWLDLTHIVQESSNIGAAKIGIALGREGMAANLDQLGFGQRTGTGFPGESRGRVRKHTDWSAVGLATISFGHGVAVTSLQLATAYRVLAAGGMYRQPALVRSIRTVDGREQEMPLRPERRVYSQAVAAAVGKMMEAATSAEGTGWRATIKGYAVAGKTGTAQKLDPVAGGYSRDDFVAVFAGYVPAEAPRVVIVVAVDEPQGAAHTGGEVAAPIFAEIAATSMRVLAVPPRSEPVRIALQRARQVALDATEQVRAVVGLQDLAMGEAGRLSAALARGRMGSGKTPATGLMPQGSPSFAGLTARAALVRHRQLGLSGELRFEGAGVVIAQRPPPGAGRGEATVLELGHR